MFSPDVSYMKYLATVFVSFLLALCFSSPISSSDCRSTCIIGCNSNRYFIYKEHSTSIFAASVSRLAENFLLYSTTSLNISVDTLIFPAITASYLCGLVSVDSSVIIMVTWFFEGLDELSKFSNYSRNSIQQYEVIPLREIKSQSYSTRRLQL